MARPPALRNRLGAAAALAALLAIVWAWSCGHPVAWSSTALAVAVQLALLSAWCWRRQPLRAPPWLPQAAALTVIGVTLLLAAEGLRPEARRHHGRQALKGAVPSATSVPPLPSGAASSAYASSTGNSFASKFSTSSVAAPYFSVSAPPSVFFVGAGRPALVGAGVLACAAAVVALMTAALVVVPRPVTSAQRAAAAMVVLVYQVLAFTLVYRGQLWLKAGGLSPVAVALAAAGGSLWVAIVAWAAPSRRLGGLAIVALQTMASAALMVAGDGHKALVVLPLALLLLLVEWFLQAPTLRFWRPQLVARIATLWARAVVVSVAAAVIWTSHALQLLPAPAPGPWAPRLPLSARWAEDALQPAQAALATAVGLWLAAIVAAFAAARLAPSGGRPRPLPRSSSAPSVGRGRRTRAGDSYVAAWPTVLLLAPVATGLALGIHRTPEALWARLPALGAALASGWGFGLGVGVGLAASLVPFCAARSRLQVAPFVPRAAARAFLLAGRSGFGLHGAQLRGLSMAYAAGAREVLATVEHWLVVVPLHAIQRLILGRSRQLTAAGPSPDAVAGAEAEQKRPPP